MLNFWCGESPYAEGHCQSDMFFCALRVVCGLAATYREAPGTTTAGVGSNLPKLCPDVQDFK